MVDSQTPSEYAGTVSVQAPSGKGGPPEVVRPPPHLTTWPGAIAETYPEILRDVQRDRLNTTPAQPHLSHWGVGDSCGILWHGEPGKALPHPSHPFSLWPPGSLSALHPSMPCPSSQGRQRGPGRVKWHPCRGEGDSDREPERQNLSEKIQRQRLRNETLREAMMRRGREGGREDRNGGTGLYRAAALST